MVVDSLPNNKILDLSTLEVFSDEKSYATENLKLIFGEVENIVGKGENAGDQHFLLFIQNSSTGILTHYLMTNFTLPN